MFSKELSSARILVLKRFSREFQTNTKKIQIKVHKSLESTKRQRREEGRENALDDIQMVLELKIFNNSKYNASRLGYFIVPYDFRVLSKVVVPFRSSVSFHLYLVVILRNFVLSHFRQAWILDQYTCCPILFYYIRLK